jgi:hypothetical protein
MRRILLHSVPPEDSCGRWCCRCPVPHDNPRVDEGTSSAAGHNSWGRGGVTVCKPCVIDSDSSSSHT